MWIIKYPSSLLRQKAEELRKCYASIDRIKKLAGPESGSGERSLLCVGDC